MKPGFIDDIFSPYQPPTRKDKTMNKDDANSMTVQDVIYALVGQNVAENEVLVSINNSDPYAITDIDVQENPETGNKKVVLLAS